MDSDKEKRRFLRIPKEFIVEYKELTLTKKAAKKHSSKLVNISVGGILLESGQLFPPDTLLKLELKMPSWQKHSDDFYKFDQTSISEPFTAIGKVVRSEEVVKGKLYKLGVELVNVDKGHSDVLRKYLESLA